MKQAIEEKSLSLKENLSSIFYETKANDLYLAQIFLFSNFLEHAIFIAKSLDNNEVSIHNYSDYFFNKHSDLYMQWQNFAFKEIYKNISTLKYIPYDFEASFKKFWCFWHICKEKQNIEQVIEQESQRMNSLFNEKEVFKI